MISRKTAEAAASAWDYDCRIEELADAVERSFEKVDVFVQALSERPSQDEVAAVLLLCDREAERTEEQWPAMAADLIRRLTITV